MDSERVVVMKVQKSIVIISLSLAFLMVIGVSYSFFTYYRESDKSSQLITGEIYLNYHESTDTIDIDDEMPLSATDARLRDDNFVTFSINGKNTTTNRDTYYEVFLTYGDKVADLERLKDESLRFDLIETRVVDGVSVENKVLSDVSYDSLDNKTIWVNTIPRNTTTDLLTTYELRMWISDEILISNTDNNADYTTDTFKESFASIRVGVRAGFDVKTID